MSEEQIGVEAECRFAVVPEWVLFSEVSAQAVRLYAVLARKADNDSGESYYSRRKLAGFLLSKDPRVVDKAVTELEMLGAVTVVRGRFSRDGDPTSNLYKVHVVPKGVVHKNALPSDGSCTTPSASQCTTPSASKRTLSESQLDLRAIGSDTSNAGDLFDEFWNVYPIKHGKREAQTAWGKIPKDVDRRAVIDAARAYRDWLKAHPNPPKTKYAQGWLNGRRWEDVLEMPEVSSSRTANLQAADRLIAIPGPWQEVTA